MEFIEVYIFNPKTKELTLSYKLVSLEYRVQERLISRVNASKKYDRAIQDLLGNEKLLYNIQKNMNHGLVQSIYLIPNGLNKLFN